MTDPTTLPPAGGMSRTLRIVLFASLALNMFLLGAGAVTLTRLATHHDRHASFFLQREFPGPGMILRTLPQEERNRLEQELGDKRQAMREQVLAARRARREALAAFSDSNYSAAAMDARLKAMREADMSAVGAVHDVLAEVIEDLSPEDRVIIVHAFRDRAPPLFDRPGPMPPPGAPPPPDGR